MSWAWLAFDLFYLAYAVSVWLRRGHRPTLDGVLALALPTTALVALFVLAGLSSPHAHRASHAGIALADIGCLAAAAVSWAGADRALRLRSRYRIPLVIYGFAVGLFFVGEAIAVTILNW